MDLISIFKEQLEKIRMDILQALTSGQNNLAETLKEERAELLQQMFQITQLQEETKRQTKQIEEETKRKQIEEETKRQTKQIEEETKRQTKQIEEETKRKQIEVNSNSHYEMNTLRDQLSQLKLQIEHGALKTVTVTDLVKSAREENRIFPLKDDDLPPLNDSFEVGQYTRKLDKLKEAKSDEAAARSTFINFWNGQGCALVDGHETRITERRTPDIYVFAQGAPQMIPNIRIMGEIKKVGKKLSDAEQGQTIEYCASLLELQPQREFAYAFLTNLDQIIFFKVKFNEDRLSVYQSSTLHYRDEGGASRLASLLAYDDTASGLGSANRFKGYEITKLLGRGKTSRVYQVKKQDGHGPFAMKVLSKDKDGAHDNCFQTEVNFLREIRHPSLPVLEEALDDEKAFIMSPVLANPQSLNKNQAGQLFDALAFVHKQGYFCRDIRPGNILIDQGKNAFLTDFGYAVRAGEHDYCGTFKTASKRVLNMILGQTICFSMQASDDLESLVKTIYLSMHPPVNLGRDAQRVLDFWEKVPNAWKVALNHAEKGDYDAAKKAVLDLVLQ